MCYWVLVLQISSRFCSKLANELMLAAGLLHSGVELKRRRYNQSGAVYRFPAPTRLACPPP